MCLPSRRLYASSLRTPFPDKKPFSAPPGADATPSFGSQRPSGALRRPEKADQVLSCQKRRKRRSEALRAGSQQKSAAGQPPPCTHLAPSAAPGPATPRPGRAPLTRRQGVQKRDRSSRKIMPIRRAVRRPAKPCAKSCAEPRGNPFSSARAAKKSRAAGKRIA